MHPFLFHIGRFPVPTYGVIALLAFLACVLVMRRYAVKEGLEPGKVVDAVVLSVFVGLVSARLLELIVSFLRIQVEIPERLSAAERDLYERLRDLAGKRRRSAGA